MFCYLLSAGWQFFCWIVLSALFTTGLCSVIYHRWRQNVVKTKQVANEAQSSVSLKYLPHIEAFCDLFLYRLTVTWNLFVLYDNKAKVC